MSVTAESLHEPHEAPEWTLGDRLRKSRTAAGFDQKHMAVVCGVDRATVSKWETNKQEPKPFMKLTQAWAQETNHSHSWLIGLHSALTYKRNYRQLTLLPYVVRDQISDQSLES